jgi:hypothetical protein
MAHGSRQPWHSVPPRTALGWMSPVGRFARPDDPSSTDFVGAKLSRCLMKQHETGETGDESARGGSLHQKLYGRSGTKEGYRHPRRARLGVDPSRVGPVAIGHDASEPCGRREAVRGLRRRHRAGDADLRRRPEAPRSRQCQDGSARRAKSDNSGPSYWRMAAIAASTPI